MTIRSSLHATSSALCLIAALTAAGCGESASSETGTTSTAKPTQADATPAPATQQVPGKAASNPAGTTRVQAPIDMHQAGTTPTTVAPAAHPAGADDTHGHGHVHEQAAPAAAEPEQFAKASIFSPNPEVDFGEVVQGETVGHSFTIGNRGEDDLEIRRVTPTCGCTVASVTTPAGETIDPKLHPMHKALTVLKPDETCEINIEFNSAGQPTHALEKHINVTSSDDFRPSFPLKLKALVIKPLHLEPALAQFGELVRGEEKSIRVTGVLREGEKLAITGWEAKPDFVEVTLEEGTSATGTQALYFNVRLLPTAPLGYISETIVATTDHEKISNIRIPVYANIKSDVTFEAEGSEHNKERLDFGVIKLGDSATRTLLVKNRNPAIPYNISDVEIDSKYADQITCEVETIEDGTDYELHLTTAKELDARFFRGTLMIKSDHRDLPEKSISFHGWVLNK